MSSNPLLSPLGAIPVSSHELGESPPLRYPRHLIILASLLMALESSLMIAGFVLGFEQIQKSGHLIDFTWREYLVQSIYHCLSFPSSLFDLAGISVLKAIFLTTLLLICRFNYRIRRQKGPRYAVYGILVLSLIYGIRKATLMITLVTEPVELPVPFEWTAIVLGVFMAFTVIQISVAVPFLGMWLKALERDLGDAVPPTPRETEDDAEPEIKWRIIYRQLGLLKPDIWILLIGFTALVLNSLSQLAIPWLIGRVVDAAVFSGRDPDGLHNRLYYLATIFVLGGITGFIRYLI